MRYARPDIECLDDQVASSGATAALMDQLQPLVQRGKPILSWSKVLLWSIFSLVLVDDTDYDNDGGMVVMLLLMMNMVRYLSMMMNANSIQICNAIGATLTHMFSYTIISPAEILVHALRKRSMQLTLEPDAIAPPPPSSTLGAEPMERAAEPMDERTAKLFPNSLKIAGIKHICDNLLAATLSSLPQPLCLKLNIFSILRSHSVSVFFFNHIILIPSDTFYLHHQRLDVILHYYLHWSMVNS